MANSYFRFKQFLIEQERSAMKVTTDACLFGSLFSTLIYTHDAQLQALDIGTGTGLLSLMFAQQFPYALIDAIEIDEDAAAQALDNIIKSPWSKRVHSIEADIIAYKSARKYDVIFSNPPFFDNSLNSPNAQRNKALHSTHLDLKQLFSVVERLLLTNGTLLLLLPFDRAEHCKKLALQLGFYCVAEIKVKQTAAHNYFRSIMKFSQTESSLETSEIIIKINGQYSPEFASLLSPFYLAL